MGENEQVQEERSLADILAAGFERFQAQDDDTTAETAAETPAEGTVQEPGVASGETQIENGSAVEAAPATGTTPSGSVLPTLSAERAEIPPAQEPSQMDVLRAQNQQLTGQVQQLAGQMQQLIAALQNSQAAVGQQSQLAEEAVNQAAGITPPAIDLSNFQYQSPEEQQNALAAWGKSLMDAARQQTIAELKGDLDMVRGDYQRRTRDAEIMAAKEKVYGDAQFPDFREHDADIDRILAAIPQFEGMEASQARMIGGLINRGMRNDPRRTMTADELVTAVRANPDAMRMLEIQRAQEIAQKNENLPRMSASQGMTGAAPVPENKPKTFDEMRKAAAKRLGFDI